MNCAAEPRADLQFSSHDKRWMRLACLYAGRAQGQSWPNPAVGCVLVSQDNRLIAAGCTQPGGRPHAEANALQSADEAGTAELLTGGTAYVTLEPCAHEGRGPACAELLVEAGLGRVVYAVEDPDKRVNGQGRARLLEAGLMVESGLYAEVAAAGLNGFLSSRRHKKPYLISKIATSADGFISADPGQQTWLTNETSRVFVHDLRSRMDGLLTGIDTVLVDDPALTCRLPGRQGRSPVRLILDSGLRLPPASQLVRTVAESRVVVFCAADADNAAQARLQTAGVEVIRLAPDISPDISRDISRLGGGLNLTAVLDWCEQNGLSTLMVEAGTRLNSSLFEAGLLDRIIHLKAHRALKTGVPGLLYDANKASALAFRDDSAYIRVQSGYLCDDCLTIWQRTG